MEAFTLNRGGISHLCPCVTVARNSRELQGQGLAIIPSLSCIVLYYIILYYN